MSGTNCHLCLGPHTAHRIQRTDSFPDSFVGGTVRRLLALDLFCGAGGATKGLQRAGFHVTGVGASLEGGCVGQPMMPRVSGLPARSPP